VTVLALGRQAGQPVTDTRVIASAFPGGGDLRQVGEPTRSMLRPEVAVESVVVIEREDAIGRRQQDAELAGGVVRPEIGEGKVSSSKP
jgi:hypothetical protein